MAEVTPMRRAPIVLFALATSVAVFAACAASTPPPATGPEPTPAVPVAVVAPNVGDAGPTTTTTQTLGAAGAGGTKLTPAASADPAAAAGPKHHGEPGRSREDMAAIIHARRDEARACYDHALANHPGIEGNIYIRWMIDPTGKVITPELDTSQSEMVEPSLVTCLSSFVSSLHFAASPKGFETKAGYMFNFHPKATHKVTTE